MNIFEAIKERRSVKHYDTNHKLSIEEESFIFDIAKYTPSSFNIQHWRIVKVSDKALRVQLREAAWNQEQVTDASLLLIICADLKAWDKAPERYWQNASQKTRDDLVIAIRSFYADKENLQHDEALRSIGLIAQTIMLAVKGMGYDSCPMIGFDSNRVAELINLPQDHIIGMMITIGKPSKPAQEKGGYLSLDEMVIENHF